MSKSRLEALADGIFAIVLTLLVIEIKVPHLDIATNEEIFFQVIGLAPFL